MEYAYLMVLLYASGNGMSGRTYETVEECKAEKPKYILGDDDKFLCIRVSAPGVIKWGNDIEEIK